MNGLNDASYVLESMFTCTFAANGRLGFQEQGNAAPSMVANAIIRYRLDDDSKDQELVQAIKDSAGTLYAASVETVRFVVLSYEKME